MDHKPVTSDTIRYMRILWGNGLSAMEIKDKLRMEKGIDISHHTVYNYIFKKDTLK